MLRIVVLVSGGGTNLQAIIDSVAADKITNTEIVAVISNNKSYPGPNTSLSTMFYNYNSNSFFLKSSATSV